MTSFRGWRPPIRRSGIGTGGETRTRTVRLLKAPSLPLDYARVRRQGLEPCIPGLRVQCCTRIARDAWSRTGESNPDSLLGRQAS
jgi:hypothetical protein